MPVSLQPGVLRKIRQQKILTQAAFADLVGLSERTIQKIEAGEAVNYETVRLLAKACGVEPSYLTGAGVDLVGRPYLELHLHGEYDTITFSKVMLAVSTIQSSLPDGVELKIVAGRAGSVILTVDVPENHVANVLFAVWDGKYEPAGIVDAKVVDRKRTNLSGDEAAAPLSPLESDQVGDDAGMTDFILRTYDPVEGGDTYLIETFEYLHS
jgi:transcriptional regulator with XRE-family HTH domain